MARVFIPSLLRPLCNGQQLMELPGATVGEVLRALVAAYPAVEERIFRDGSVSSGRLQPGMSVAVDGDVAAHPLSHPVQANSELSIIPAIAGG